MTPSSLPDLDGPLDAFESAQLDSRGLNPWAIGLLCLLALPVLCAFFAGGVMVEVGLLGLVILTWIGLRERSLALGRKKRLAASRDALIEGLRAGKWKGASECQRVRLRSALGEAYSVFDVGPTGRAPSLP